MASTSWRITVRIIRSGHSVACLGGERGWGKALIDSKTWGDAYEAAFNARDEIVDQIEKHQALTLEGLRVNGHVQAVLTLDEWTDFDMLELDQGGSPPRCQNQQVVQANSQ